MARNDGTQRVPDLTSIAGAEFDGVWAERVTRGVSGREVPFLGRATLIQNERATGRDKDRADLVAMGGTP